MNSITPPRIKKPRETGLTMLIDKGYPIRYFQDVIESFSEHIDFVKFGWGTSLVTKQIQEKIEILNQNGIDFCMGGTLFEKFYQKNCLDSYKAFLNKHHCQHVEISNGTIPLANSEKAKYIEDFSQDFCVFSEVGLKDVSKSEHMPPREWIRCIKEDLVAGANKVITEAREGGTSGICRSNGELRFGLIDEIIHSGIDIDRVVFEAPTKSLQTFFIKSVGYHCNLANIAFSDVIALETLRLGLRSDTFFMDHLNEESYA